jgi:hypothetical protein
MRLSDLVVKKGIAIDTNLLLLYFVGYQDKGLIGRFTKRLSGYSFDDYDLLIKFTKQFKLNVTTPSILTEVSNFLDDEPEPYRNALAKMPTHLELIQETHWPTIELIKNDPISFKKFGLTDATLIELAKQDYVVLTQDSNLSSYIVGKGYASVDFKSVVNQLIQKKPAF